MDSSSAARGRPRSEDSRRRILHAAAQLVVEHGYEQLSLGGVAELAGVGKQTLYRWWPSKASLVADCVLENAMPLDLIVATPGEDAVSAIRAWLTESQRRLAEPEQVALFRGLVTAAASDPSARTKMNERFVRPLVDSLNAALETTAGTRVTSPAPRPGISATTLAEMLIGAMIFTFLQSEGPDEAWVENLMGIVEPGIVSR